MSLRKYLTSTVLGGEVGILIVGWHSVTESRDKFSVR